MYTNARSLLSKVDALSVTSSDHEPDIIYITETWNNGSICNPLLNIPGYHIDPDLRIDRQDTANGIGGGIIVNVRAGLKVTLIEDQNPFDQYCRFVLKGEHGENLFFTVIYRSPNSSEINSNSLCELINGLDDTKNNIILGDFNFPKIDWKTLTSNNKGRRFLETLEDMFMTQIIDFPTHSRGNILDLALLNRPESLISVTDIGNLGNSDHTMIKLEIVFNTGAPPTVEMVPDWQNIDTEGFNEYLDNIKWDQILDKDYAQTSWTTFTGILEEGMMTYIPHRPRRPSNKPIWSNRNISRLSRVKARRWKTFNKYRTPENFELYKDAEKQCKNAVKNAKKNFEKKLARNKNKRQFNAYVKAKTKSRTAVGPLKVDNVIISEDKEMAETLNGFFTSVFTRENTENIPVSPNLNISGTYLSNLQFSKSEVEEKIKLLKTDSSPGPDKSLLAYYSYLHQD